MVRVTVSEGILEGEVVENEYGGSFCSFKGIPYAEPPLGELRFKAPRLLKPWSGVRNAKEFGPVCYQFDFFKIHKQPRGSEDCLYLNVYTPNPTPPEPLPVMLWIHGGGFASGSGNDDFYGPEYLVKHGVVLVTINYRLELLGFLCLDTEDVPGNAGMKDQVAALRWVNRNISNFGGDPNNVTIFGESAGGASVGYHLVSPMTKGLFKRAIAQSGSSFCWWSQAPEPRERALAVARKLGCRSENDKELYEFFKSQPVESLIMANTHIALYQTAKSSFEVGFPVVNEKQFGDKERFFHGGNSCKNLANSFHDGVEVLTGFTRDDGLVCLGIGSELNKKLIQMTNFYEEFVPQRFAWHCSLSQQFEIGKKLKQYYLKKRHVKITDCDKLVQFYSAYYMIYDIIQMAKALASKRKNKLYLYQFSCLSERNVLAKIFGVDKVVKDKQLTCHMDDAMYLFDAKIIPKVKKDTDTYKLIDKVTTLWTNFAKYGDPTPDGSLGVKWSPYTLDKQAFLDIGNELIEGTAPHEEEMQLWEGLFRKYAPEYVYKQYKCVY